jgi:hypothetical protein
MANEHRVRPVETAGVLRQDAGMGDPVSEARSSTLRAANAAVWIAAGVAYAVSLFG